MVDVRWDQGLRLFDEGKFFECHEAIEALWLETPSDDVHRDLYKGVIQAAASLYQLKRGVLSGAKGLLRTSVAYLEKYRPEALGLDVSQFIDHLRNHFSELEKS